MELVQNRNFISLFIFTLISAPYLQLSILIYIKQLMNPERKQFSKLGNMYIGYAQYHNNSINKAIHIVFIPIITATLVFLLSYIPHQHTLTLPHQLSAILGISQYHITLGHVAFILTTLFYFFISIPYTLLWLILGLGIHYGWLITSSKFDSDLAFKIALIAHIVSWAAQFIGHGVFQKRKPALLDNILQVFSAPLFVMIQIGEFLNINKANIQEWNAQVDKKLKEFRKTKKQ